jgi:hypothetical protein
MKAKKSGTGWRETLGPLSWPFMNVEEESDPPREAEEEGAEAPFARQSSRTPLAARPQYWSTSILNKYKLNAW